jgi:hypothetical protein
MRSRPIQAILKKAALGAAFFMAACASVGPSKPAKAALHGPDDRGQQLFDQAVKLCRRYGNDPQAPAEPLQSILTELSLYHDDEQASYLSGAAPPATRKGLVDIAPWAQHQLALRSMQRKDYVQAATQYAELGERFEGRMITEISEAPKDPLSEVGPEALCGEIAADLALARLTDGKGLVEGLAPKIGLLHDRYGAEAAPCEASCDSYGRKALGYLWQALALQQADFKDWFKATQSFAKGESSADLRCDIWEALGEGCARLGKHDEAAGAFAQALACRADAKEFYSKDTFPLQEILFSNLLKPEGGPQSKN